MTRRRRAAEIRLIAYDANFQSAIDKSNADFTLRLSVTGVPGAGIMPAQTFLGGTVPEPFTERAAVTFGLAKPGRIALIVYSAEGRAVRELVSGTMSAGTWDAAWDGKRRLRECRDIRALLPAPHDRRRDLDEERDVPAMTRFQLFD